jgi:hypothetical protein
MRNNSTIFFIKIIIQFLTTGIIYIYIYRERERENKDTVSLTQKIYQIISKF